MSDVLGKGVTADSELAAAAALADATANPTVPAVAADLMVFNGATWDRERGNMEGTLLASAARTATTASAIQTNYNARGVYALLIVTVAGTGTLTLRIRQYADAAGTDLPVNMGTFTSGITTIGRFALQIAPGITPNAIGISGTMERVASQLYRSWIGEVVHSDSSSWTYSVLYSLGV